MLKIFFDKITEVFPLRPLENIHTVQTCINQLTSAILLRGIQLTLVQRYWGSTVNIVFSYKIFIFYEANTCVALPNAWRRSVRALS
jgi:hypothetical protein